MNHGALYLGLKPRLRLNRVENALIPRLTLNTSAQYSYMCVVSLHLIDTYSIKPGRVWSEDIGSELEAFRLRNAVKVAALSAVQALNYREIRT